MATRQGNGQGNATGQCIGRPIARGGAVKPAYRVPGDGTKTDAGRRAPGAGGAPGVRVGGVRLIAFIADHHRIAERRMGLEWPRNASRKQSQTRLGSGNVDRRGSRIAQSTQLVSLPGNGARAEASTTRLG